jgi:hypothetical protein
MKQYESVAEAIKQMGGVATLGQLYQTVLKIPDCEWKTKTPFASIRRIVQTHPDLFFKVKPGVWALTSERARIAKQFGLTAYSPTLKTTDFSHSFYQGLVVEIGNLKGYATFVPNQDKNKPYLRQTLADITGLGEFYPFTHDSLLRRARTVDVTWFNERKLPRAFFEIEHSTEIHKSLLKFVEFQDFRIRFYIVADEARRNEYNDKLAYAAFKPIRSEVEFVNYEKISDWHARLAEDTVARELEHL